MPRMKQRRRTATEWTSENPVLLSGEIGLETDTRKVKYGDGASAWNDLAYAFGTGTGDIVGPASATDNALVRFDGTTGKLVQNSNVTLTDGGVMSFQTPTVSQSILRINPTDPTKSAPFGFGVGEYIGLPNAAAGTADYCVFFGHNVGANGSRLDGSFALSSWAFEQRYQSPVNTDVDLIETHLYHQPPGVNGTMNRVITVSTSCHANDFGAANVTLNTDEFKLIRPPHNITEEAAADFPVYQRIGQGQHIWVLKNVESGPIIARLFLQQSVPAAGTGPLTTEYVPANLLSSTGDVHIACSDAANRVLFNHQAWINNDRFQLNVVAVLSGGLYVDGVVGSDLSLVAGKGLYLSQSDGGGSLGFMRDDGVGGLELRHNGDSGDLSLIGRGGGGAIFLQPRVDRGPVASAYEQSFNVNIQGDGPADTNRVQIVATSGQTGHMLAVRGAPSTGYLYLSGFDSAGRLFTRVNTAPADGDLVAGELRGWFDQTNGAAKLMIKAKQADGTVRTGEVALT